MPGRLALLLTVASTVMPAVAGAAPEGARVRHAGPSFPVDTARSVGRAWRDPDSLTLGEAIRIALANNAQIAAARHELASAGAGRDLAEAARLPTLRASGFASGYTADQRLLPPTAVGQPLLYTDRAAGADLVLELPLFLWGRLRRQVRSAERIEESYAHRLDRADDELEYEVSATFFDILRQRRVVASVEFAVRALEEHERTVMELMEQGKAARVDVLRTRVRLADLRQRLLSERSALEVSRKVLSYLLGGASDGIGEPAGELALVPFEPDVEEAVSQALARRPDLRADRAARDAREQEIEAVRAERWPAVYLRGSYAQRWAIAPDDRPAGSDASLGFGTLGLTVTLPLLDGGAISARVARERAQMAAAEERIRDLELGIRLQVEEAVLGIRTGRGRVEATESAIQEGQETLRIERELYRLDKGAVVDVLDAQSELLAAETAYFGALAEYNTAIARYRLVTGESAPW